MKPTNDNGYAPIRDYALLGDCHGSALVSRDGSVDWCSLKRFDADPVFCRILDATKGGFFCIQPAAKYEATRQYVPGTNILCTTFTTEAGTARVTDFMPVGRDPQAGVHDYVSLRAPFWLVRIVEGISGTSRMRAQYKPTVDFARRKARLVTTPFSIATEEGAPFLKADTEFAVHDDLAEANFEIAAGERRHFIVSASPLGEIATGAVVEELLAITRAFWENDAELRKLLPNVSDPAERRAIALDHLGKCLRRAKQFSRALDVPARPPRGTKLYLMAGDAIPTPALATVGPNGQLSIAQTAPGEGTVLRSSALMDERISGQWSPELRSPIVWEQVNFFFKEHLALTQDIAFTDNLLFILLEQRRR